MTENKRSETHADRCPLLSTDGQVLHKPMRRSDFLRYLLPTALTLLVAFVAGVYALKADFAVLQAAVQGIQSESRGHVSREVLTLQLENIRLEQRLLEQKIDSHVANGKMHAGR